MRHRRWLASLTPLVLLVGCTTTAIGSPTPSAPAKVLVAPKTSTKAVLLAFDGKNLVPTKLAASKPLVTVETLSAGSAKAVYGSGASSAGIVMPSHSATSSGQRLILAIRPTSAADPLSPGAKNVEFGADVRLDATSSGSPNDNGDNVLQRGLFADFSQIKLQVDKRTPSCTVKSGSTRLFVKSTTKVGTGWHRIRCGYRSGKLTVSVASISGTTVSTASVNSISGTVKPLSFNAKTPVTVGGKIGTNGKVVIKNSDQFNGALDNVFVDVP
jgi:hypothetical protein